MTPGLHLDDESRASKGAETDAGSFPGSGGTNGEHPDLIYSETNLLLDTLLENSPDAIYFKDRHSRFVHYSKAFARIFRLDDLNALKGKTDADFFADEHARHALADEQMVMRTGKPIIGKLEREIRHDGHVSWALTSKLPWRDRRGQTIGIFGISKDVTVLKEAEEKLAHERQLLRALLDNVPDCIFFKDRESRFVRVSKSKAQKTLRHSPGLRADVKGEPSASETELLLGLTDFDVFTHEHARLALEDELKILRTGEPVVDRTERQTHPDGRVTWALCTKLPWRDNTGEIIGTFGISRDITAVKQAEAELEVTHKRLVETSRLAGMAEVATDVLHNVGNTLNSINVACSVIQQRVEQRNLGNLTKIPELLRENAGQLDSFLTTDPKGKCIPEYLELSARTLEEDKQFLIDELRRLRSHIDHVNQIVAMQQSYAKVAGLEEKIEVPHLIEDAIQINAAALDRHGILLKRDFQPLPVLLVDKHKVLQILVNLISNAKYALDDAAKNEKLLTLRAAPLESDRVTIEVVDNGSGIAPENLTRIFAHGFTTRANGHGFGLHSGALAARELGGTLSVHSNGVGQGATFTLTLPLQPPRAPK